LGGQFTPVLGDHFDRFFHIKKGLLNFSIESPFTWILFIVFGLLITAALPNWKFEDILIDFPKQLILSNNLFQQILGYTFIVSIISIMLSTIDSFIMGISFTYAYDINSNSKKLLENKQKIDISITNRILQKGKYFGFISVLTAVLLFVFFDNKVMGGGELFINLLLTFYSAILSFLPLIFGIIFLKHRAKPIWASLSMVFGAATAICIGLYSILFNPIYAWYPVIISIFLSSLVYSFGLIKKI